MLASIIDRTFAVTAKRNKLEITVARSQTTETIEKIKKKLAKQFGDWDQTEAKIDPGIIGGFVAKTDQYILNASIKNQLEQLRKIYES